VQPLRWRQLAASAAALPPLSDPPSGEYRQGKFVWIDLVTADLPAAEKFYGTLFGWTFTRVGDDPVRYTLAWQAGYPVAGLAARAPAPVPAPGPTTAEVRKAWWVAYMSVPDVDRAAAEVVAKGGKVLIPARGLEGRGRMALLADPDGAPLRAPQVRERRSAGLPRRAGRLDLGRLPERRRRPCRGLLPGPGQLRGGAR
jgi:predicted enzyme related to lactoylglutathione lyase